MGGNDKRKLTRFIVNNFMLNLASPLAAECRAADLLEVHLPQFGEYCYRRQCALHCGRKIKLQKGLILDTYTPYSKQNKLIKTLMIHTEY